MAQFRDRASGESGPIRLLSRVVAFTIAAMHPAPALALLLLLALAPVSGAWTLTTERAIAQAGLELGPEHLQQLARLHERAFEQGLLDAARHEQQNLEAHLGTDRTRLEALIRKEIDQAVLVIKERRPIEELVYQLGVLAHLAGDLNHPFHLGEDPMLDGRRIDYEQYVDRRRERFPTVFYGIEKDRALDRVLRRGALRVRSYEPLLRNEYFKNGEERWSRQFDDRSTAFAIGSLSWSHSVSDLVNIYYHLWERAGGDVRKARRLRPGIVRGGSS